MPLSQLAPQVLIGNLTADPELRYTQSGIAVANFTVAHTPREFDRQSNEWKDGEALFFRVSDWRDEGENAAASLRKGDRVIVIGRPKPNKYTTKEGSEVNTFEWVADEVGASLAYATASVTKKARTNGGQAPAQAPEQTAPAQAPAQQPVAAAAPVQAAPVAAPAAAAPVQAAPASFDDEDFS